MPISFAALRRILLASIALCTAAAHGQVETNACAIVFLHGKSASGQSLAALARKLQPVCAGRTPEMPWSTRPTADRNAGAAMQEIARQVKALRQQGYKRVVLAGHGLGANAAIAFAGANGDAEGVVALGGDAGANPEGLGALPALTPRMPQHIPLLWVVGARDPLHALGEAYAYTKASPHPLGRYVTVQADAAGTPDAAAKTVLEWVKSLD